MDKDILLKNAYDILKIMLGTASHTHTEIVATADRVLATLGATEVSIRDEIVIRYEENHPLIKVSEPDVLVNDENDGKWFERKQELIKYSLKDGFFERYKRYLRREDFDESVIHRIELDCARTLKQCANPEMTMNVSERKKRGLVVGDVQSGKTANYLGLINLACDYGYKIIVLLAGMTDSLRQQTQGRVDSGFIGAISDTIGGGAEITYVGVSADDQVQHHYAVPLTNNENDFVKFVKKNLNATSGDFNKPIVLVVKKNGSVLKQVVEWLKPGQHNISCDNILIVDDEADNASINTKKPEEYSASVINGHIRNLFNNFPIATYVGYTATPFANIFINPEDDEFFKDLFPSDFIVLLNPPSNYFGATKVFAYDGESNSRYIRELNESEPNFLPVKHKVGINRFDAMPQSMKEAVLCFLINNVIRTIRGAGQKHRSMMINISVLNDFHDQIHRVVSIYVNHLKDIIEQDDYKPTSDFIKNQEMAMLYGLYMGDKHYIKDQPDYYADIRESIGWEQIKRGLYDEIKQFNVVIINNRQKKGERFSYDNYKEVGARVIAIGGYVLSRGLTLEGLMISYFSRNSSAYDSLLQMCRWFGYRPRYEDLCRIYMSPINIMNFRAVVDAVEDLKDQFREMALRKSKPSEFGLMIKESPDTLNTSLLITSRNKMYNSDEIIRILNYGGTYADTSKLYPTCSKNEKNINTVNAFFSELTKAGLVWEDVPIIDGKSSRHMIRDIDQLHVARFIRRLQVPYENVKFDVDNLADYIEKSQAFPLWDLVIASGSSNSLKTFEGVRLVTRSFRRREGTQELLRIGDNNNRLIDPNIFNSGLTREQMGIARANERRRETETGKPSSGLTVTDYLSIEDRKPLLVIYPIELQPPTNANADEIAAVKNLSSLPCVLGFAVGFPKKETGERLKYRANKVKLNAIKKEREEPEEDSEYDSI